MSIEKFLRAARDECRHVGGHCVKCKYKAIGDGGQSFCSVPADMSDKYIEKIAKEHEEDASEPKPMIIASEVDVQRVADAIMERMKVYFADTDADQEEKQG